VPLTAIVFLVGFAAFCVLAFTRHPIYGLLAYLLALYIEPSGQWWGQGGFSSIRWVFVAAAVTIVALWSSKNKPPPAGLMRSGLIWGMVCFVAWVTIQGGWALDQAMHTEFWTIWVKFLIIVVLICRCIDSEKHLRLFLWAHVAGCFYLGWLATSEYSGGRFEGFGSAGFAEANAGALQLVTGLIAAASLFLGEKWPQRAVLGAMMLIIVNGVVTTMSRSGFIAAVAAGLVFNLFTPKRYRMGVIVISAFGALLFMMLTNATYWERMDTIKLEGADIPGVDTGGGRLEIITAQWQMFHEHPLGCGHMCTSVLSPNFLEKRFLSYGQERASHNTFMTMVVDHGIPGIIFYISMLVWTFTNLYRLLRQSRGSDSLVSTILPGVAGVLAAISVADMFVQYPRLEVRVWFLGLVVVLMNLKRAEIAASARKPSVSERARPADVRGEPQRGHY
jgi:hypothetical protein